MKDLVPCLRFDSMWKAPETLGLGCRSWFVQEPEARGCSQASSGRPGPAAARGAAVPGSWGAPRFLSFLPSPVTSPAPKDFAETTRHHRERLST